MISEEMLLQCRGTEPEIKKLNTEIARVNRLVEDTPIVSDTVRGSRWDLTIGPIKVGGIADPEYKDRKKKLEELKGKLEMKKDELVRQRKLAEEFIDQIPEAKTRQIFRLYYMDGLTWIQVARRMNSMYPKERTEFTEDSCRMRKNRIFQKN